MAVLAAAGISGAGGKTVLRTQHFDRDPGWEAVNNHIVPEHLPTVSQDFGYSKANHAGKAAGEMGGQVWRASEPAFYADKIGPRTLDDKLSAAGTFALTKTSPERNQGCPTHGKRCSAAKSWLAANAGTTWMQLLTPMVV